MSLRRLRLGLARPAAVLVAAVVVGTVACGGSEAVDDEPPIGPAVIARYTGVAYDQECADDVIVIDEATYYPLPESSVAELDPEWYHASADPAGEAERAPEGAGNGGSPGTLVVFADGVAEFIADDGEIAWLSLVEPEIDLQAEFGC